MIPDTRYMKIRCSKYHDTTLIPNEPLSLKQNILVMTDEELHKILFGNMSTDEAILRGLEEQTEHLNKDTLVCVVEDVSIKRVGNALFPQYLWIDHELGIDNLDVIRGLPKVIIFPKSEEGAKRWKFLNVAKVGAVIRDPNDIVKSIS